MGELNKKPIHNVFKKYRQMNLVNPYRFQSNINPYEDVVAVFSLRKEFTETKAPIRIRRSSDNTLAYVFWNNTNTIGLDSLINTVNDTTPSATTLGTWIGSDDGFVRSWWNQNPTNSRTKNLDFSTNSTQPKLVTSGVLETENGHVTISFIGANNCNGYIISGQVFTEMNYNNPHTVITLSSHKTANTKANLIITENRSSVGGSNFNMINDRSVTKQNLYVNATTDGDATLLAQVDSASERLQTGINNGSFGLSSYYNGVIQNTATFSGTYLNNFFALSFITAQRLNGNISLIAIYGSDKTSNLSAIHAAINSRYSIY